MRSQTTRIGRAVLIFIARCLAVMFLLLPLEAAQPEINVWATDSGNRKAYHCPRSKWYGVGSGKEMGECAAIRQGYQPATGAGCGSTCINP